MFFEWVAFRHPPGRCEKLVQQLQKLDLSNLKPFPGCQNHCNKCFTMAVCFASFLVAPKWIYFLGGVLILCSCTWLVWCNHGCFFLLWYSPSNFCAVVKKNRMQKFCSTAKCLHRRPEAFITNVQVTWLWLIARDGQNAIQDLFGQERSVLFRVWDWQGRRKKSHPTSWQTAEREAGVFMSLPKDWGLGAR